MDKICSPTHGYESADLAVYIVLDDVGGGIDAFEANKNSVVENITRGMYLRPARVIAFDIYARTGARCYGRCRLLSS
jgi:hypothetical protein